VHYQDVVDVQQNLDALNLDAARSFLGEAHLSDVVVDAELRHQLRMDYFLDVVDVELHLLSSRPMRMDYFLDVASPVYFSLPLLMLHLQKELLVVGQRFLHVKL